jgi:hypothetical protein
MQGPGNGGRRDPVRFLLSADGAPGPVRVARVYRQNRGPFFIAKIEYKRTLLASVLLTGYGSHAQPAKTHVGNKATVTNPEF